MLSTTSPSPYLLFDVEGCVRLMLDKGLDKFKSRLELRSLLTSLLKPPPTLTEEDVNASSSSIQIMSQDDAAQVVVVDMTKVVMKVDGLTGAQLYKRLDEKRIDIEKYTQQAIVVTIHINIEESEVRQLAKSIKEIGKKYRRQLIVLNIAAENHQEIKGQAED